MKRFYISRLGCPKNDVDADYIAGYLSQKGLTQVIDPEDADLLIVNTCAFIQSAKEESIAATLELGELKKKDDAKKLVLTGCMAQRYARELATEMPEIDGIFGLNDFTDIAKIIDNREGRIISRHELSRTYYNSEFPRIVNPDEHFAYLKISDGCNNRCSYCVIPDIRGHFRSRTIESIVAEAEFLLESGKKELILVSQESTSYGCDIYGKERLLPLLDALTALKGDFWLRVMYLHPGRLTNTHIDYIIDNPVICSYFDLPLQHINDRILAHMNRKVTRREIECLISRIRSKDAAAAVRTTFIVGFPGETDAEFDELCRFVDDTRFDRLGAFAYSPEEGSPAAGMADQVDEDLKQERYSQLMLLQQDIAFELNEAMIGKTVDVLIESVDPDSDLLTGRTRFDAPDIDQSVKMDLPKESLGKIEKITITGTDGYDLHGGRKEP